MENERLHIAHDFHHNSSQQGSGESLLMENVKLVNGRLTVYAGLAITDLPTNDTSWLVVGLGSEHAILLELHPVDGAIAMSLMMLVAKVSYRPALVISPGKTTHDEVVGTWPLGKTPTFVSLSIRQVDMDTMRGHALHVRFPEDNLESVWLMGSKQTDGTYRKLR